MKVNSPKVVPMEFKKSARKLAVGTKPLPVSQAFFDWRSDSKGERWRENFPLKY